MTKRFDLRWRSFVW